LSPRAAQHQHLRHVRAVRLILGLREHGVGRAHPPGSVTSTI
jgi:hypothetical protein